MSAEHPKQLSHSICERTREEEEARGQRCLNGRASGGGRRLPNGHALSFVPRPKKNWGMLSTVFENHSIKSQNIIFLDFELYDLGGIRVQLTINVAGFAGNIVK